MRDETFEPSSLRARACCPDERRTPTASRITINAKQQEKMNKSESMPFLKPIVVETEDTRAEWLEGIPPVRQNSISIKCLKDVMLLVNRVINVFRNWLKIQLETAARNIGL